MSQAARINDPIGHSPSMGWLVNGPMAGATIGLGAVAIIGVDAIAQNTGIKPSNIQKVKDHLFHDEHLLDRYESLGVPGEMKRFDQTSTLQTPGSD